MSNQFEVDKYCDVVIDIAMWCFFVGDTRLRCLSGPIELGLDGLRHCLLATGPVIPRCNTPLVASTWIGDPPVRTSRRTCDSSIHE